MQSTRDLRKIKIKREYIKYPEGSVLIEFGDTKVLCNASVEERVPPFKEGSGEGWVTAEYSMLPRSTGTRNRRDIDKLKKNSRSVEIQRLIGRSLRAAVDFKKLGERTITIDCDVLQADGGTRTAAITGGFIALYDACVLLMKKGIIKEFPLTCYIAAVSVGIVEGEYVTDLCYEQDSKADVDMNVVMTSGNNFVEVQGTGEKGTFDLKELNTLLKNAVKAIKRLNAVQRKSLKEEASYIEDNNCSK
ncbi:MAG: ribonuclease PH [Clostridia bacterium]|nr:ribonuclease PH [Clostridia bacterium]